MKKVILDTNLLFSALLSGNVAFREIMYNPAYQFFSAKYLIVEIFKHKERIIAKSKAPEEEVYLYLHEILSRIEFINEDLINTQTYIKAFWLCKDSDENDTPFVALALQMEADLWTNDEELKIGLRKKGFRNFFDPL